MTSLNQPVSASNTLSRYHPTHQSDRLLENFSGERESLIQTADRLQRLAADLIEIAAGRPPRPEDLANAPILDRYYVAERKVDCLVGVQSGHPTLTGPVIKTSEVYVTAMRSGWARTLSRYYRLGRPLLMPFDA